MRILSATTGIPAVILSVFVAVFPAFSQTPSQNGAGLAAALSEVSSENWAEAVRIAGTNQDPIAAEIVEWHRLRAGVGTFGQYEAFVNANADWPGLPLLFKASEASIPDGTDANRIVRYFASQKPQTGRGALRLAQAYKALGQTDAANAEAARAWTKFLLSQSEQAALWGGFSNALRAHNVERLDMLLWRQRLNEGMRMYDLVPADQRQLAEARVALQRSKNGVTAMINALPASVSGSGGLAFDRLRWRVDHDDWDGVHDMLVERSTSHEALGRPEYWQDRRRTYARRAMRAGNNQHAYLLASQHFLTPEQNGYKDLEWLAGFLALRKLNDPQRALLHFQKFRASVQSPISVGRAGYWLGRTYEAMGQRDNARAAYTLGATYQTSFYGQLAAERAGLPADRSIAGGDLPQDWTRQAFLRQDSVRAALVLHSAGHYDLTRRFLTHASETMTTTERAALGELAIDLQLPNTALKIGKEAAKSGVVIPRAYYPITDLATFRSNIDPALTMSIARQESELFAQARSSVGALGLMQVMPATAKAVAKGLDIGFSQDRLLNDWQYNATLGNEYLDQMLKRYSGSTVLAAAAYNAGPHRADRWIREYGDPRSPNIDAVDWIETIPFNETRNYVMRVNESMFTYRARISGRTPALNLAQALKTGGGS